MNKINLVIFDFDGTVADSVSLIYCEVKKELKKAGISEKEVGQIEEVGVSKFLKRLKMSRIKMIWTAFKIQKRLKKRIDQVSVFEGMESLLRGLKKEGFEVGMVTNNKKKTVKKFIRSNDLDLFNFVYSNFFLRSKVRKLEKAVEAVGEEKKRIVYIGDQKDDILDAKKVGLKSIGVTWGLSSFDELKKAGPDYIADSPADIYDFLVRS